MDMVTQTRPEDRSEPPVWVELTPGEGGGAAGIPKLVGQVVEDVRDLVQAEIAVYKAKTTERVTAYRGAAIFFGAAAVLALEALGALLVGLIMTLATKIGPGFATLIVVGLVFAAAGVLAYIGKSRLAPAPGTKS